MIELHPDPNFKFETIRALGAIPYGGADLMEILEILPKIKVNDFDSWYNEWFGLAQRVLASIDESKESSYSPVTLRNVYFRASHYIFVADFFLHKKWSDPRMSNAFKLYKKYFDKANALLPIPGVRASIKTDGFEVPIMSFRTPQASKENPRPTLIIGGGFESVMEETYHQFAVDALSRGYNVVLYEGPGHRTVLETYQKGFVHDWEKAVNPVVDHIFAHKDGELSYIDTSKLGLIGMSLGGYLCLRAAASEPRLAAVLAVDGVYSFMSAIPSIYPELHTAWEKGDKDEVNRLMSCDDSSWDSGRRWFRDDLLYTFQKQTAWEALEVVSKMTLANGVAQKIKMPAFIGLAQDDMFFKGEPEKCVEEIGSHASLEIFTNDLGAQLHCASGAQVYQNQRMCEWFATVVGH